MEYVRFKDILKIKHGFAFKGEYFTDTDTGQLVLTPGNFTLKGGFQETSKFTYETDFPDEYKLNPNDLIVTMTDLSKAIDTIGYSALVPNNPNRIYLHNQRIGLVDVFNSQFDRNYIYWVMRSRQYQRTIANSSNGATVHHTSPDRIYKYPCRYYPLPTQRRIASILSAYDSLIECNSKRIRLLEQMAENLYKEWFVRFRFPGHQSVKIVNGLPEGWKVCRIGDVCETIGGGTPSTTNESYWNGDVKWVTPTDITSKSSLPLLSIEGRITEEGLKKSSAKLLPPYTLLMTSRASIGYFGLCTEAVCTNQGFISIIPNDDEMRMYLLYNFMSRKEEIVANANGSTFLEISKGRFRKMKIVIPTLELQKKFNKIVWNLFNEVLSLERQSTLLTRQRDLLLPRLMSGKLEV